MTKAYKVEKVKLDMRLESWEVEVLIKIGWKSCAATYSYV